MAKHAAHADNKKSNKKKDKPSKNETRSFRRREAESLKRSENETYLKIDDTPKAHDSNLFLRRHSNNADFSGSDTSVLHNKLKREKLPEYDFGRTASLEKPKPVRLTPEELDEIFADEDKPRGKGIIIAVAVICVIVAFCVGITIYSNGKKGSGDTSGTPSATDVDNNVSRGEISDLAVVTVSGKKIQYNSKNIKDAQELDEILKDVKDPTLSLINIDADINTYNSVAKVLNRHGGKYELMDENNTSPSIKSDKN